MKLTKQKLEQLIMEEFKTMSQKIFDKRKQYPEGGTIRALGDKNQPINRPEYHDKLTRLAKDDYPQARELADALDEPLDIEVSGEMETMPFASDNDRIRTFRKWMVDKGYGPQIRRILQGPDEDGHAEVIFKEFLDETNNYRAYNAVLAAYRVNYIPFVDEQTGKPLPLGSSRPWRGTNTYHYPRP